MNAWDQFREIFVSALEAIADGVSFLGGHRWAASIIILTVIVRTLLLPLAIKQVRSMQAMQRLRPEIERLQKKYAKEPQKRNEQMMELYKREGVNPLGGCLPAIAQFPVLIAMYYAIPKLKAIADGNMPFLGLGNLANNASDSIAGILLLALMTATSLLSARQLKSGQNPQQDRMMMLLPLVFIVFMWNFPAALVLYWTTQNVYQLVQQTIMLRGKPPALPPSEPKRADVKRANDRRRDERRGSSPKNRKNPKHKKR